MMALLLGSTSHRGFATDLLCFAAIESIKNGFVEVKFKPLAGKEDQAGSKILVLASITTSNPSNR
jgi:hypothetical protein